MDLMTDDPRRLGDYTPAERLGEGGQGIVYLAYDALGEPVAVKVLRAGVPGGQRARARFLTEAAAARRVTSGHVARLLDADIGGDRPYIVSEYIDGPTLQDVVADEGPLTGARLRRVAVRTAMALAEIHRAGVVHRDVKPGNVVLGPGGAKVIDFGIARVLDDASAPITTSPIGTPAYMAPEQIEGDPIGPAADVFAWASTMTYAATGRPPFGTDPAPAVLRRIADREPDLDGLSADLHDIVARCLAKDPETRPTAADVVRRLRRPAPPRSERHRLAAALFLVILTGFLLGLAASMH